jgi:hypothetical protein
MVLACLGNNKVAQLSRARGDAEAVCAAASTLTPGGAAVPPALPPRPATIKDAA